MSTTVTDPSNEDHLIPAVHAAAILGRSAASMANDRAYRLGLPFEKIRGRVFYRTSVIAAFLGAGK